MDGSLENRMTLGEIVRAVILLKLGDPCFKEEALEHGFRELSKTQKRFQNLFRPRGTEMGGKTNDFDATLYFLLGHLVVYTSDYQHLKITSSGSALIKQHLQKEYGDSILDTIKPLAEEVWRYAGEYEMRSRSEF